MCIFNTCSYLFALQMTYATKPTVNPITITVTTEDITSATGNGPSASTVTVNNVMNFHKDTQLCILSVKQAYLHDCYLR